MATISENKDIDYIQKDFNSSMDAMISYANVNFGPGSSANRLWTNFNSASFSRNWLEIVAFVSDALFFYFDVQATQTYLQTATVRSAVEDIAKQFGFTPATASSASGDATFTVTAAVTIPRGFLVQSTNGEQFYLTNGIVAGAAGQFTGTVLQGSINSESFTAVGLQNEEFDLAGLGVIRDLTNVNPLDISPQISINGISYTLVDSFIRHDGSDSDAVVDSLGNVVGGGGRVFTLNKRRNGTEYVKFGDGIFGKKLAPADVVVAKYRTGGGSAGNIAQGSLSQLVSSATGVTTVTNVSDFSGGADEQSIEQLRELIPASLRTLERAVAEKDYSDILIANFSEVFAASTGRNSTDPGTDINIYVVPQGTGITKITDNTLLSNRLSNFLELRKMVTVQFQLLDAFGVATIIGLEVFISDTSSKTTISNAIQTAIEEFFDLSIGGVNGAGIGFAEDILLKDIGDLVKSIDGVVRFEIKKLTYRPRIEKYVLGLVTDYQTSEVNTFRNVSEAEWLLAAAGPVSETIGEVLFTNTDTLGFTYDDFTGKVIYADDVDLSKVAVGDTFTAGSGTEQVSEIKVLGEAAGQQEQSTIVTIADEQGTKEITELTTTTGLSLGGAYLLFRDAAGSVAVWFNADTLNSEPSHGANRSLEVAILSTDTQAQVASKLASVVNGDSEFSAFVSGVSEETELTFPAQASISDSDYFLIYSANNENSYYVYFNVTGAATDPSISGRLPIEVDIQAATTADDVAQAVQIELDALLDFSATVATDTVTVTNSEDGFTTDANSITVSGMSILVTAQGANSDKVTVTSTDKFSFADIEDGDAPTNFTITITQQGVNPDTLDGTYFLLYDSAGSVAFWYDIDNSGTTIPAQAATANRSVEITTVTSNMSANAVATQTQLAIDADSQYSATVLANTITVDDDFVGTRDAAADGTVPTGFDFSTAVQGASAASIGGKYWLLNAPNDKAVYYVWYNTGASVDPAPAGADEGIEVAINIGDDAMTVADQTRLTIDAFTLSETTRVITTDASSLNGRYFVLYDTLGSVAFWYNISGSATISSEVADRLVEINTVVLTDDANDVAALTRTAIDGDAAFSAIIDPTPGNENHVIATGFNSFVTDGNAGTSGFTMSVDTQGISFSATWDTVDTVEVTNVVEGTTTDSRDGDTSFTFNTTTKGKDDEAQYTIQGVNNLDNVIYLLRDQNVSTTVTASQHGSIVNGNTSFSSFKCYKKILGSSTNISVNSITDNNLDLSALTGISSSLSARVLLDNSQVFVDNQYATGEYFLVDNSANIWEIIANDSSTLTVGVTAINDAAISSVAPGSYRIVQKLVGSQVLFNGSTFNVQFNSHNTLFSIGALFTQIGTIGDDFQISTEQSNVGSLGTPIDIISFNDVTKTVRLNGSPDLQGVNTTYKLIDASGQVLNISASDSRVNPSASYDRNNITNEVVLAGSAAASAFAQGFKVDTTDSYTTVSMYLRRQGNAIGSLVARIVADDGTGKPDLTSLVAISKSLLISGIPEEADKVQFAFDNPPTLTKDIQYHLVISGDAGYQTSQDDSTLAFENTGTSALSYSLITSTVGTITYSSPVDLSNVVPGNFFRDDNGDLFKITIVDDALDTLTIETTPSNIPSETVNDSLDGACLVKDNIHISYDDLSPSYADGSMSTFDGIATWSAFGTYDAIFSVEGPKSLVIDSNLTPVLGPGATISTRYYDDNNELSLVIGLSEGTTSFATDVNALGKGTIGGVPGRTVDSFVFRTSRVADDIVNLRLNEIPQISADDIVINIFGGVD